MSAGWTILLISPNRKTAGEVIALTTQQLPSSAVTELSGYPTSRILQELRQSGGANLCYLDVESDPAKALATIPDLLMVNSAMQIVTIIGKNDPDLILQCLRHGAAEFLVQPYTAEQFQAVLTRLATLNPAVVAAENSKVVCVVPAKGACGASTVAANLAIYSKRLNKNKKALLADLDPVTGTISFLLKLKSTYSFVDAMAHESEMDASIWNGLVVPSNNVDVLLPPDNALEIPFTVKNASQLIQFSRTQYEMVVIDAGSAYGDWYLSMARLADEILLVATNELPSLQAAQRVMGYYETNHIPVDKINLVINRYNDSVGLTQDMIEMALTSEVRQLIPSDYESVQRALLDGKQVPSATSFGKSMTALAESVFGKDEPSQKKSTFSGMFAGLFKRK